MIHAYDSSIVTRAQKSMGSMIDYAVYGLNYGLDSFYQKFLDSKSSLNFEIGDSRTIMGMSGIELCHEVLELDTFDRKLIDKYTDFAINGKSKEYWTGWALAYFQWDSALGFKEIDSLVKIEEISSYYNPYHEMDITRFSERMGQIIREGEKDSPLKKKRTELGYTQKELSVMTGIPIKTLQQYEQRQKDINHARVDYLVSISKALNCNIELLLERV